jgi:hypothetical protein
MWQPLLSQSDSIFPRNEPSYPAEIKEISETVIHYSKPGSSISYTIATKDVVKIKLRNGKTEVMTLDTNSGKSVTAQKEANTSRTINAELKAKIEKLATNASIKIAKCAFATTLSLATFIDWSATTYDIFHEKIVYVHVKAIYEKHELSDREYFNYKITIDEGAGTVKWKLLSNSNPADLPSLLKCQSKSL